MTLLRRESRALSYQDVWGRGDEVDALGARSVKAMVMEIPVAQRCMMLLLDSVGSLPRDVFRTVAGAAQPVRPLPSLVAYPSREFSWSTWIRLAVWDLVLDHNAFGLLLDLDTSGRPRFIEWMPADEVNVSGVYPYPEYSWRGEAIPRSRVLHLRRRGVAGKVRDPSPFEQCKREVKWAIAQQAYSYGWFRDGAHPSAILSSDQVLDGPMATRIKARFMAAVGKGREPAVLGAGLKYDKVQSTPNESQNIETIQLLNAELPQLFGMAPELVGAKAGGSLTYANLEMFNNRLRGESVQPLVAILQEGITGHLPGGANLGQYLKLDTDAMVLVDLKTRTEVQVARVRGGITTQNWERDEIDLPPLPGGDVLWPPTGAPTPIDPPTTGGPKP